MTENLNTFAYDLARKCMIAKRKRGNQGNRIRRKYKDVICAFDIETTRISDTESIMYIWQFQYGPDHTITGRSWKECIRFFRRLSECCGEDEYFVIFVHNLSFEFQFLQGQYHFTADEVFATAPRKILKCDMFGHLELRCSYYHSNMSLDEYTRKMGAEHQKLSGVEFDYDKLRYPWTPLSDRELLYCINDVRGLVEAIRIEMDHDKDNLYTFPLTSTGYVRRDIKKAMKEVSHGYVKSQLPDWDTYLMLLEAFRGGNTHANRHYAGYILNDVHSADISSSYPSAECNNRFPVSKFVRVDNPTSGRLADLVFSGRAVLARIAMKNVRLQDPTWGCPYIPFDKCRNTIGVWLDNGRILAADYLEITVTDIDLKIILSEYLSDEIDAFDIMHARYGWLPDPLIDCIEKYYLLKTQLKTGPEGETEDDRRFREIQYQKQKAKLNSVYGISAQRCVRLPVVYDRDAPESFRLDWDEYGPEALDEYNKRAFFCYQWGCWCTAIARFRLHEGIEYVVQHGGEFVYCDTDSVKYLGDVDWTDYNKERILDAEASLAYADDRSGARHYMGVYEYEGKYEEFATRGAKKYAYTQAGKLHITIAGVNKVEGANELEAEGGLIAFLKEKFTFSAGETEAVYVDHIRRFEYREGKRIRIAPCVTIRPSFKTLSDTDDYLELLKSPDIFEKYTLDKYGIIG